jgi:hypothetical protein
MEFRWPGFTSSRKSSQQISLARTTQRTLFKKAKDARRFPLSW